MSVRVCVHGHLREHIYFFACISCDSSRLECVCRHVDVFTIVFVPVSLWETVSAKGVFVSVTVRK